ncbi:hypothetical protein C0J52_08795 [Blattella germanica]|nr:hypothetical protein C0J52_08795 [Blattella germanica]
MVYRLFCILWAVAVVMEFSSFYEEESFTAGSDLLLHSCQRRLCYITDGSTISCSTWSAPYLRFLCYVHVKVSGLFLFFLRQIQ